MCATTVRTDSTVYTVLACRMHSSCYSQLQGTRRMARARQPSAARAAEGWHHRHWLSQALARLCGFLREFAAARAICSSRTYPHFGVWLCRRALPSHVVCSLRDLDGKGRAHNSLRKARAPVDCNTQRSQLGEHTLAKLTHRPPLHRAHARPHTRMCAHARTCVCV